VTQRRDEPGNTVIAVRHGELVQPRREAFLDAEALEDPDAPITLAYYFWVIRTPSGDIVVDTGFEPGVARRRGRSVLVGVPEALTTLGISPDDEIDVILTHAHYDHIGNASWFRRARIHLAAEEYAFWRSPQSDRPELRALIEESELAALEAADAAGRLHLLESEREIAPGVTVLFGRGHTPGELMVRVETATGSVLLTSDAVHFDEELDTGNPFRHMCDVPESRLTYDRIRALRDKGGIRHVVSGHDDSVSATYPHIEGVLAPHAVLIGAPVPLPHPMKEEVSR
jgi:glyoxylase-like metal-dependent hydrolase (beta-lactamase superfamily II)